MPITIAFKKIDKKSKFYSKLITKWTDSNYYHCEIIIDNVWISATEGKGVTINELLPLKDTWDYFKIDELTITSEQAIIINTWIYAQSDKKYDWLGIALAQVLPFKYHNDKKWFCSELVTKILQLHLIPKVLDLEPHLVSPGDLAKIFNLE